MKKKLYFFREKTTILIALFGLISIFSLKAQVYTDTTGLIADLEAGLYEEYVLAPASVTDTFKFAKICYLSTDAVIKAKDDLGFKPVLTGNIEDRPSQLFRVVDVVAAAEIKLQGLRITGTIDGEKAMSDGCFRILTENVSIVMEDVEIVDVQGYNAVAKIYNSGANITLNNVLVYNCGGKIVQVNYKDDDDTPNYVPHMGNLTVTNSSFIKCYKRIWFELGAGDVPIDPNDPNIIQRFNAGADNVTIDQCTFYNHIDVNVMQGRSLYEFAGDQPAVKEKMSITNTVFAYMDKNLNADSATTTILDYCYIAGFGAADDLEDYSKYNPTNTVTTDPVFADTANGAWDLMLQNEAELMGSPGKPIGDPRWFKNSYPGVSVEDLSKDLIASVYTYGDLLVIESKNAGGMVEVFDITGKSIRKLNITSARTETILPTGLYIVRVSNNSGSMTRKVITQ